MIALESVVSAVLLALVLFFAVLWIRTELEVFRQLAVSERFAAGFRTCVVELEPAVDTLEERISILLSAEGRR